MHSAYPTFGWHRLAISRWGGGQPSAPDPANPDARPYNTFRFQARKLDPATDDYDMGTRDYDPGLNRFLSRDLLLAP